MSIKKTTNRQRRKNRVRSKIFGTKEIPRISVFKSNKYISGQVIDDEAQNTLVQANSQKATGKTFTERASQTGKELSKKTLEKGVEKVVFDRNGYMYTGRVKAFAEGLREGGLKF